MENEAESRPKRRKIDKHGRLDALAKLRNLKGQKNKYEVNEIQNVYDVVDEKEYAERALKRAEEGFIEDDGTGEYYEDGREMFDEEGDDEKSTVKASSGKSKGKKRIREEDEKPATKNKLTNFFGKSSTSVAKTKNVGLKNDDILSQVLNEITTTNSKPIAPKPMTLPIAHKADAKENSSDIKSASNGTVEFRQLTEQIETQNAPTEVEPKNSLSVQMEDDSSMDALLAQVDVDIGKETPAEIKQQVTELVSESFLKGWIGGSVENVSNEQPIEKEQFDLGSNKPIKFWFWDAWEDPERHPGEVYLFGRIQASSNNFSSICIHVKNVRKSLFVLPRKTRLDTGAEINFMDCHKEFSEVTRLKEFLCKKVTKEFAFHVPGVNIPKSSEYLWVRYDGNLPTPDPKRNYKTIAHIFGCNTNSIETLLLERKIKGPCWLEVSNYKLVPLEKSTTWCKMQIVCEDEKSLTVMQEQPNEAVIPPPLVVMTLNVRSAMTEQGRNEIVMISCLINRHFAIDKPPQNPPFSEHFCLLSRPQSKIFPYDFNQLLNKYKGTTVHKFERELALLNCFLAKIQNLDPDLIVTQDAYDFQLDLLCRRLYTLNVSFGSKVGRLKRKVLPKSKKVDDFFVGRMICNVKSSAEELLAKQRDYSLDSLCTEVLKVKEGERKDIYVDDVPALYENSASLLNFISLTMQDSSYTLRLMCELNVLPMALQITNIAGNLMGRTLLGGRSERNEYLLLHAFTEKNYIVPDKAIREAGRKADDGTRGKAQYAGGLVLEPKKGFYDNFILLMDFNSLYPSIIQEFNICFTTVPYVEGDEQPVLPDDDVEVGILPKQIRRLVESRRQVKELLKKADLKPEQRNQHEIRQKALKLTANSMYGCLGFGASRFFAQHLAALITKKGRDLLTETQSTVESMNYNVVYGDTDSIMIATTSKDYNEVLTIGTQIKQMINKRYSHVELDIDGIFKFLLLLKKKKYAAVVLERTRNNEIISKPEYKGLDIVRRDWSRLASETGRKVLEELFADKSIDERLEVIHQMLEQVREKLKNGEIVSHQLEISKQLTRAPGEYQDSSSLPHVLVALRMNSSMNRNFKKGDTVSYIICEDGTDAPATKRGYHIDEIKLNNVLKVDVEYYLTNQLHPVISRLLEVVDGIDSSRVAQCLGLDPKKFKATVRHSETEADQREYFRKSNLEEFRLCEKFSFKCFTCKTENIVASLLKPGMNHSVFEECTNPECNTRPVQYSSAIVNRLTLLIRKHISRFYDGWLFCDDPICKNNTKIYSHVTDNDQHVCLACRKGALNRLYSQTALFNQLNYFKYMFNIGEYDTKKLKISQDIVNLYNDLRETAEKYIESSGFHSVNFFDVLQKKKEKKSENNDKSIIKDMSSCFKIISSSY